MGKLRHIAFISKEPKKLSDFYQKFFGLEEVRVFPSGSRMVIDGLFNLAFLQQNAAQTAVVGTHRSDGSEANQTQGIAHYGFMVDNLEKAVSKLPPTLKRGDSPQVSGGVSGPEAARPGWLAGRYRSLDLGLGLLRVSLSVVPRFGEPLVSQVGFVGELVGPVALRGACLAARAGGLVGSGAGVETGLPSLSSGRRRFSRHPASSSGSGSGAGMSTRVSTDSHHCRTAASARSISSGVMRRRDAAVRQWTASSRR